MTIDGWRPVQFLFGGLGSSPRVARSDIFTASLPGALAGPGVATTAARSDIVPIGVPWPWLTGTPPSGFIFIDGSNVSRTTYAPLFALWGTTFGVGDGSTTFGLPDWRGRSLVGAGTGAGLTARTLNATGGDENLAQHNHGNTTVEGSTHAHAMAVGTIGSNASNAGYANEISGLTAGASIGPDGRGTPSSGVNDNTHVHGTATAGTGTAGNMQPFFVVNWIVRAA